MGSFALASERWESLLGVEALLHFPTLKCTENAEFNDGSISKTAGTPLFENLRTPIFFVGYYTDLSPSEK